MVTVIWVVGVLYICGACLFGLGFISSVYQSRESVDARTQRQFAAAILLWPYMVLRKPR